MQRYRPAFFVSLAVAVVLVLAACSGPHSAAFDDPSHDVVTLGSLSTKGVSFLPGSLKAIMEVTGIDRNGLTIEVSASGYYELLCGNPGGSRFVAPGVNPVADAYESAEFTYGEDTVRGRLVLDDKTAIVVHEPTLVEMDLSAALLCPNAGWTITAKDDFFFWTGVTLRFYDEIGSLGDPVIVQTYACETTAPTGLDPAVIKCDMTSGSTKAGGKR